MVAPAELPTVAGWLTEMAAGGFPLVVCVSPDPAVREQVAGRLDGRGILLLCPDVDALRTALGPGTGRAGEPEGAVLTLGQLVIEPPGRRATVAGRPVALTRIESALLGQLAAQPKRVYTYERLYRAVWGGAYLGDNAILHSAVKRLRRKLRGVDADVEIETVRGVGYRLAA